MIALAKQPRHRSRRPRQNWGPASWHLSPRRLTQVLLPLSIPATAVVRIGSEVRNIATGADRTAERIRLERACLVLIFGQFAN